MPSRSLVMTIGGPCGVAHGRTRTDLFGPRDFVLKRERRSRGARSKARRVRHPVEAATHSPTGRMPPGKPPQHTRLLLRREYLAPERRVRWAPAMGAVTNPSRLPPKKNTGG